MRVFVAVADCLESLRRANLAFGVRGPPRRVWETLGVYSVGVIAVSGVVLWDSTIEYAAAPTQSWVEKPELYKNFIDPGDGSFEEIGETQAEELARRYGVQLDAP